MDILPSELLEVILSFLPGLHVGNYCLVSRQHNKVSQRIRRRMYLAHKVRTGLMTNYVSLAWRKIYYCNIMDDLVFDPCFYFNRHITSYKAYKEEQMCLADYLDIDAIDIHCYFCGELQTLNYYIFDDVNIHEHNRICYQCYKCYHRGIIGYYSKYGEVPRTIGCWSQYRAIAIQAVEDPVPPIPPAIEKYFDRLEGGYYNWSGL